MKKLVSVPNMKIMARPNVLPLLVLALLPQTVFAQNATEGRYSKAEVGGIVAGAMVFVVIVGILLGIVCSKGLDRMFKRS